MEILSILTDPNIWIALLTLTALELVLGIDNIIFISILVDRLPAEKQEKTRKLGLFLAMFMRISLLMFLSWMVSATEPLFTIYKQDFSIRDLILIGGGIFLLWKSTHEIHQLVNDESDAPHAKGTHKISAIIFQIIVIDLVFSLDSIITAVGMVDNLYVMITAVVVSVGLMMCFSHIIGKFVSENPTIKMLALSFLLIVGMTLTADGLGTHVPKGYIYFAMLFSLSVELLNIKMRRRKIKK